MNTLKIKATFYKRYIGSIATPSIPKGTIIEGYLSQPLDTLVFCNNSVYHIIPFITQYANIKVVE